MFNAPHPRYRLYTTLRSYTWFIKDLLTGNLNKGDEVTVLEKTLAKKFQVKNVVCTPMARMAIYYSLKYLLTPEKKEVIMSPYTIADVVNMVAAAGGIPVFTDLDRPSCNIDFGAIKSKLSKQTGAVLITHLHGIPTPHTEEIAHFCAQNSIHLLEDAAQAVAAIYKGKRLGTFGTAGILSIGTFKNINCWYGGAILTNSDDLSDKVRKELANYPFQSPLFLGKKIFAGFLKDVLTWPPLFKIFTFWIFRLGFLKDIEAINKRVRTELDVSRKEKVHHSYFTRMTPFQARLALTQVNDLDKNNKIRNEKGAIYHKELKNIAGIIVPEHSESNIYTYFPIQVDDRNSVLKWLMYRNRDSAAQHLKNTSDLPGFNAFPGGNSCPNARATAEKTIILPCYYRYPDSEILKNISVLKEYFLTKREEVKKKFPQKTPSVLDTSQEDPHSLAPL